MFEISEKRNTESKTKNIRRIIGKARIEGWRPGWCWLNQLQHMEHIIGGTKI